ncbi:phage tail tape measure protein [Frondihabitans sp. VKM Ac-2883]|uniref:phage tail tape measure protein n=1 Tax=Frondihabitans sp. VKM Ac-2883 TaxID=2783823 RepID=UPI00188A5A55|nr:phage tail tape measure protein [Frondihabitans sp. VKM Ac-2883]MBF4575048.1 phage tail tape measure protein [Frondihabitans sp. VKM Ac-2883]
MADRTTRVSLVANVTNYINGMQRASEATQRTGSAAARLSAQREGFERLGKASLAFGAVAAAGVVLAVKKYADFEQAISGIQAATHAGAAEMAQLQAAAVQAGASTVYSATEAANAITELSKAGVATKDILGGGLDGALSLASAGELDVAEAAQIAATELTQFKLTGSDVPHVADLLAAGAGKAQGSVEDLSQALNQGGLVASQAGFSIEETTGTLAAFASAGLEGSDAGTSLKTAILALQNPSSQAAGVMEQYGIKVYDAQGNMKSFQEIAGVLQGRLGGLKDEQRNAALATIFGNDAVRAANVLYSQGSDGIGNWTKKVDDNGYAAETAALKLDNLKGDIERLGGAFDTVLIQTGSNANSSLRTLTQTLTGLVDMAGEVPKPLQAAGLAGGVLTASVALTGGAVLTAIPRLAALRHELGNMQISLRSAALRTAAAGVAIGGLSLAVGYFVAQRAQVNAAADELASTLDKVTGATTKLTKATLTRKLAEDGTFAQAKKAGLSQAEVTAAVLKGGDAAEKVANQIRSYQNDGIGDLFNGNAFAADKAGTAVQNAANSFEKSKTKFKDLKDAGVDVADSQDQIAGKSDEVASGLDQIQESADNSADALSGLKDQINGLGSTTLDLRSAQRDMQAAIDAVTDSVKDNGTTLDINSEQGRNNQAALDGIAEKAKAVAAATLEQSSKTKSATAAQKDSSAAIAAGRKRLIEALSQFGITGAAAQRYADKLGLIPRNVTTQAFLEDAAARSSAASLLAELEKLNGTTVRSIIVRTTRQDTNGKASGNGQMGTYATGGPIVGPGTGTSDDILARLSNGEHVWTADEVSKIGGQRAMLHMRALVRAGKLPKYANGGAVGRAQNELDADIARQKAAQRAYQDAKGPEKAALRQKVRQLQDEVAADRKKLEAAKKLPTGSTSSDRVAFRSGVRSNSYDAKEAVSDLYSMAQEADKYTRGARARFAAQANRSEVRMLALEKASERAGKAVERATDRLDSLKDAAKGLRDDSAALASSTAGAVSKFDVGGFRSTSSLRSGLTRSVGSAKEFAGLLVKLRDRGIAPAMLSEIAALGTADGLPLARSLAKASGGDIASINSSYKQLGTIGAAAGKTVADASFKTLIARADAQVATAKRALAAADKNADKITKAINTQAGYLRRVVGKALGVKGYSAGGYTGAGGVEDVAGVVHGREFVVNARGTQRNRALLEAMNRGQTTVMRPTYARASVESLNYERLASAMAAEMRPSVTNEQNVTMRPMESLDPQTALTILSREFTRGMAGMGS